MERRRGVSVWDRGGGGSWTVVACLAGIGLAAWMTWGSVSGIAGWHGLVLLGVGGSELDDLVERIERLGAGEAVDLPTGRDDEVGRLAGAVDRLAGRLRERETDLDRERERLAEERDRRGALFENTTDCVVHVDLDDETRINRVNDRFEAVFGYDAEAIQDESLVELIVPDSRLDEVAEIQERIRAGKPVAREVRRERVDGTGDFLFRFVPVGDDPIPPTEGYAVYTDITERKRRERELRVTEECRRELDAVTSATDLTTDEKIDRLLELGCQWIGVDNAVVSRVDEASGDYYIEHSVGEDFPGAGTELPLSVTYCRRTMTSDDILGIFDAVEEGLAEDPGYEESGIACYIGGRVEVDDEPYGTLCFFDDEPIEESFTQPDRTLVDLMTRWVSHMFERRAKERELRRKDRAMEAAPVGITIADATEPDNPIVNANPAFEEITGYPAAGSRGKNHRFLQGPETDAEAVGRIREALDAEEPVTVELRNYRRDGTPFWNRVSIAPVVDDEGTVTHYVGFQQDVTERKERALAMESLHEASRQLLRADSTTDTARLVVDTAEDVLDVAGVAVYLLDTEDNRLAPAAHGEGFAATAGEPAPVTDHDAILWEAFVAGNRTVVDAGDADEGALAAVEDALVVPLGDHGVLVAATGRGAVPGETRRLVETIAATAEAAFDRLATEDSLRERESELETHNRRLQRQIAVNELIRRIDRSLVAADSREAVESTVCEQLAAAEDLAFAWVGEPAGDGTMQVRSWGGDRQEYLDRAAPSDEEPAARAARRGEPVVVGNVADEIGADEWQEAALAHGLHSVLAVPLSFDEYDYGVLALYADEPGYFGDLERTVFAELAANIANFVDAVVTRRALRADAARELTLSLDAGETLLGRIASETGATVDYEGLGATGDETTQLFVRVAGTDGLASLDDLVSVTDYRVVGERDGDRILAVQVAGEPLVARCVRQGATPLAVEATPGTTEAVLELPEPRDVRAFVESLAAAYPSVELLAKREVDRSAGDGSPAGGRLLSALTDRQREVLRTAYHAGYFEWPRESSGEDVAEMLGVSQPAVNRHLRRSQARLFDRLFAAEPAE